MNHFVIKVSMGLLVVCLIGGSLLIITHYNLIATQTQIAIKAPSIATVRTAAWYVAHPKALTKDDARCSGDAATIPQSACQNIFSAEEQLAPSDLQSLDNDGAVGPKKGQRGN